MRFFSSLFVGALGIIIFAQISSVRIFAETNVATVTRCYGKVQILSKPSESIKGDGPHVLYEGKYYVAENAKGGSKLDRGNVIQTGASSRARLIYDNGDQITVAPDSFYQVRWDPNQKESKPVVDVLFGKLRAQISKDGPRSGMSLKTRSMVMGVRGTDFVVNARSETGASEVHVLRGAVAVKPVDKNVKPVQVPAGNSAEIKASTPPPPPPKKIEVAESSSQKIAEEKPKIQEPAKKEIPKPQEEPAITLRPTTKTELITIQTNTIINKEKAPEETPQKASEEITLAKEEVKPPAKVAEEKKQAEELAKLEAKAIENTLQDIKKADPKLYASIVQTPPEKIDTYQLNTATVEKVFKAAPVDPETDKKQVEEEAKVAFLKYPPPDAPELTYPRESEEFSYRSNQPIVKFNWNTAENAKKYEIQVARNDKFTDITTEKTLEKTDLNQSLSEGTYYFRVRSYDEAGRSGNWGKTKQIAIRKVTTVPENISPKNLDKIVFEEEDTDRQCEFSWTPISGISKYKLIVSRDPNFRVQEIVISSEEPSTSVKIPTNGTYYWYVEGREEKELALLKSDVSRFMVTTNAEQPVASTPKDYNFGAGLVPCIYDYKYTQNELAESGKKNTSIGLMLFGNWAFRRPFELDFSFARKNYPGIAYESAQSNKEKEVGFNEISADVKYTYPTKYVNIFGTGGVAQQGLVLTTITNNVRTNPTAKPVNVILLGTGLNLPLKNRAALTTHAQINAAAFSGDVNLLQYKFLRLLAQYSHNPFRKYPVQMAYGLEMTSKTATFEDEDAQIAGDIKQNEYNILIQAGYVY